MIFDSIIRKFVRPPVMGVKKERPIAVFNSMQAHLYPSIVRQQIEESWKYCTDESVSYQKSY